MERFDIINSLIEKKNYKSYLEIGLRNPWECFHKINCEVKHSVDPGFEAGEGPNYATFHYTSDDFFRKLRSGELFLDKDKKWDVIFIDGLHLAFQSYRDFLNSSLHLSQNGVIVFHDTNPPTIHHGREDYYDFSTPAGGLWNGTVWKSIQKIRSFPKGLDGQNFNLLTVDTDWGVTICWRDNFFNLIPEDFNSFFDYNLFSSKRFEILNLRNTQDFKIWLENF
jgi:hypothetical protein